MSGESHKLHNISPLKVKYLWVRGSNSVLVDLLKLKDVSNSSEYCNMALALPTLFIALPVTRFLGWIYQATEWHSQLAFAKDLRGTCLGISACGDSERSRSLEKTNSAVAHQGVTRRPHSLEHLLCSNKN